MMFIPLKWTLKTDLYGHMMDHMNSESTVSTPYRNQSIYFPYGVPIVPIMSLKVNIFSKISTLRCRYNVHVVHIWFIFEEKKKKNGLSLFFFFYFCFHIQFYLGRCIKLTYFSIFILEFLHSPYACFCLYFYIQFLTIILENIINATFLILKCFFDYFEKLRKIINMLTQPKKDFSFDTCDESNLRLTF